MAPLLKMARFQRSSSSRSVSGRIGSAVPVHLRQTEKQRSNLSLRTVNEKLRESLTVT